MAAPVGERARAHGHAESEAPRAALAEGIEERVASERREGVVGEHRRPPPQPVRHPAPRG
jgi:hypothetical protein